MHFLERILRQFDYLNVNFKNTLEWSAKFNRI